jgi:hypothetical protein
VPDTKKYPLRIDNRTTIYVTKERCNEKYRQKYLKLSGLNAYQQRQQKPVQKSTYEQQNEAVQASILRKLYHDDNLSCAQIGERLGMTKANVYSRLIKYGIAIKRQGRYESKKPKAVTKPRRVHGADGRFLPAPTSEVQQV